MRVDVVANIELEMSKKEAVILHNFMCKNKTDDVTTENMVLSRMCEMIDEVLDKISN